MSDHEALNARVQAQFGSNAQNYVHSTVHAGGEDLELLFKVAQPTAEMHVLDVATGGGHTALRFAHAVKEVVATDLTQAMLTAAQNHILPQATNVRFELADAHQLPFEDATFDLVTCRIAAHHFHDVFRFVCESARVLKLGGKLIVQDQVVPDDPLGAEFLNAFEVLRDPSHVRILSQEEWRNNFLDAGFEVLEEHRLARQDQFVSWCERMACPPSVVERLTVMMAQVPLTAKDWMNPRAIGTADASITHQYLLICGERVR
jgi:ubiquinone/menaquinone biosynthesis C-methylase UbiE